MREAPRVTFRVTVSLLLAVGLARGDPSPLTGPPPFRDFAEFLTARDFLVEGIVERSAVDLRRSMACTCGVKPLGPYPVVEVDLSVTQAWHGTAQDSLFHFTCMFGDSVPAGTRLLVWGSYDCDDAWRPWANYCVVTSDGRITGHDPGAYGLVGHDESRPTTYADLAAELTGRPGLVPSPNLFEGAASIVLLRLMHTHGRGPDGYTYECDSIGWVLGDGRHVPREIDFPRVPDCYPGIFVGDSLMVPLPVDFKGEHLEVESCPRAFGVKNGVASGFGVPVREIRYAFAVENGRVHVRSIRAARAE